MGDAQDSKMRENIKARVFVGNIPQNAERKDLEDIFCKYGNVSGVNLLRGFAFIQFDNENCAAEAIKNEAGRMFQNRKLDIKQALRGKQKSPDRGGPRERSPLGGSNIDDGEFDSRRSLGGIRGGRGGGRGKPPDWRDADRFESPGFGPRGPSGRGLNDEAPYPSTEYPIGLGNGPYGDRGAVPPLADYPPPVNVPRIDRTNDCEIIVVNKVITEYAEFIERKLKKLGLTVDLLFPNEDVPLGRVLANISGRGSLYAIVVSVQNEEHRSITVNILHGQHQEHRNMPMDDALNLVVRNFELYLRGERGLGPLGGAVDRHPEAIQTLLNLLQQNRQLTVLQYDKLLRYLQDKRELQVKIELGDSSDVTSSLSIDNQSIPPAKQAELQNRIMSILNKTGGNKSHEGSPVGPVPPPQQPWSGSGGGVIPPNQSQQATPGGGPPPLLNDPNVQKALDNLMQGDLLRKFNPGSKPVAPSPQPLFGAYGRKY